MSGVKPKSRLISSSMPGIVSMVESSKTDCALSVTGPYESTAIVTGPMPRKPKATRPKAKIGGRDHQRAGAAGNMLLIQCADAHQADDDDAHPVGAEVTGDEAGEDVERRAAFTRRGDDFAARGAIRSR